MKLKRILNGIVSLVMINMSIASIGVFVEGTPPIVGKVST